jgi:hypothetical protein
MLGLGLVLALWSDFFLGEIKDRINIVTLILTLILGLPTLA